MTAASSGTTMPLPAGALSALVQGEGFDVQDACVVVADAKLPLHESSIERQEELGVEDGLIMVGHPTDQIVMVTQTCDLQRTTENEYTCQVAPVLKAEPGYFREVARGRRPGFAAVPWLGEYRVADLSRITTVERTVVFEQASAGRPRTTDEELDFAEAITRHFARIALSNEVNQVLSPFVDRVKEKEGKNSDEGRCIEQLYEIRLEADPTFDHPSPALTVLFILREQDLPILPSTVDLDQDRIDALKTQGVSAAAKAIVTAPDDLRLREAWLALAELWVEASLEAAETEPTVGSLNAAVLNDEELSYSRSRRSPQLDLRYLSTRAA
jgi:hypothetical protein